MLINIGSYLTLGALIGVILSLILKAIFTGVFKAIAKPIQKKEYGLRCEEISISAKTLTMPVVEGEDIDFLNPQPHKEIDSEELKKVMIPKTFVFVETVIEITNTGKKDIIKNDVSQPLTIKVPNPFVIMTCNPTPSNSQLKITNGFIDEKKRDAFTSSWNLLKSGDYYDINILAIAPAEKINQEKIEDSFFNSLDIKIYAKNIDKISKSQNAKEQDKLGLKFGFFMVLLCLGILLLNESKYSEELTPICYTIETNNLDTINQNMLHQNLIIKYNPSIDSVNFSNDSVSFNMSLEDFENTQIKGVKIDRDIVSIIHSHWIQHKVLKIIAISVIVLSILISLALLLFHYIRNVK